MKIKTPYPLSKACIQCFFVFTLSCYFIFVLNPFFPSFSYDSYNNQRFYQILLIAFCSSSTLYLFYVDNGWKININKSFVYMYILFLCIGFLSAIFSSESKFSVMYACHFVLLGGLLLFSNQITSKKSILYFLYAVLITHSFLVLLGFLNIVFSLFHNAPLDANIIYSNFINIRFFNQVQIFILPILIFLIHIKKIRIIATFFLILNILLLFIGHARGAVLTSLFVMSIIYIICKPFKKTIFYTLIIYLLTYLIFLFLSSLTATNIEELNLNSSQRFEMWFDILKNLTYKNIFIGHGPGVYTSELHIYTPQYSHPHNSFLQTLYEWGGLALLIISFLIFTTIIKFIKHINKHQNDSLTLTLFYSWFSGIFYSLVSGVIVMPVPQTLLFITWGVLLSRLNKKPFLVASCKPISFIFIFITFIMLIFLYANCSYFFYKIIDINEGLTHNPGFWSIGKRF